MPFSGVELYVIDKVLSHGKVVSAGVVPLASGVIAR